MSYKVIGISNLSANLCLKARVYSQGMECRAHAPRLSQCGVSSILTASSLRSHTRAVAEIIFVASKAQNIRFHRYRRHPQVYPVISGRSSYYEAQSASTCSSPHSQQTQVGDDGTPKHTRKSLIRNSIPPMDKGQMPNVKVEAGGQRLTKAARISVSVIATRCSSA